MILTMGDRPVALREALESAHSQIVQWTEQIVVWNGVEPAIDLGGVTSVVLDANVGIPSGRNIGAMRATGDVLVFLDDDARFVDRWVVRRALDHLEAHHDDAVVALRLVDEDGESARRHVPRIGGAGALRPGPVAGFLGGAVAIRRNAFVSVGGYCDDFFYAMEESDLALGLADAGWGMFYAPELTVFHPRTSPARHADHLRRTMRNRVLLARRRLPLVIGAIYVLDWVVISALRARLAPAKVRSLVRGIRDGLAESPCDRTPVRWRTVWTLTRVGRPPVL